MYTKYFSDRGIGYMLPENLVWIGVILIIFGAWTYIRDIFRGKAEPNLVTWFLWALAPLIAFFAQLTGGATSSAALTLAVGLGPVAICIVGFTRGRIRISRFDLICGS